MKNNHLISLVILAPIFVIPMVVVLILFTIILNEERDYRDSLNTLERNMIEKNKKRIAQKIKSTADFIHYEKSIIKQNLHKRIRQRVDDAQKIALNLYNKHHKTLSEDKMKRIIIDALRPLVWNSGQSYIWIVDYNGLLYLAPKYLRHLEGHSIINLKDASGREVIKEEIALCKSPGEGYIWDTFTQPGGEPGKQYKQLAFVKAFGHYKWYFGSSEPLDTAIDKSNAMILKKIATITATHQEHCFPDKDAKKCLEASYNEYLYIYRRSGEVLFHPNKDLVGTNIFKDHNPLLDKIYQSFEKVLKENDHGFTNYKWYHPQSKKLEDKTVFIKQVADSDWVIVAGFYNSDIAVLTQNEKESISLKQNQKRQDLLIFGTMITLVSLIIALLVSHWVKKSFLHYEKKIIRKNRELQLLNMSLDQKVKERTQELNQLNLNLESKINASVAEIRKKDEDLLRQSRMAMMGEMLSMIAHQWRQPLSTIVSVKNNMELEIHLGMVDEEAILSQLVDIDKYAQYMSKTIDDFSEFFKPDKRKKAFMIADLIDTSLSMMKNSLKKHQITVHKNISAKREIVSFQNELLQVFLNILKNAQDMFGDYPVESPIITITLEEFYDRQEIHFEDNGGGIPENIIDHVFDPYFSTKTEKHGTGLGLYMSRTIIHDHCGGEISVINKNNGACFTIILFFEKD